MTRPPKTTSRTGIARAATLALALAAGLVSLPSAASVVATSYTTWNFSGNCQDCAEKAGTEHYWVSGTLILSDEPGSLANNFRSFTYNGSNLMDAFYVGEGSDYYSATTDYALLDIVAPGNRLRIAFGSSSNDGFYFATNTETGAWSACGPGPGELNCTSDADRGNQATWTQANATDPAALPEPGSLALAGLALAAAAVRRRKA